MATDKTSAMTRLNDITECCICLKTFTDPRMLPCIHTFCLQCLQDMADKSDKKPGDEIQCPVCRKEFIIPNDGVQSIQKNFFMAGMVEVRYALNQSKMEFIPCDACKANTGVTESNISQATLRCFDCQENLCEGCYKMHKAFKMSRNHKILKIDSGIGKEEAVKSLNVINCDIHRGKELDYYCAECKKVVCVSCFVESHKTHDCRDVNTVEEEFRQMIKSNAHKISTLAGELLAKKEKSESKEGFLKKMTEKEKEIFRRSKELKEMIDQQTKSLLSSLHEIKNRHLKEIQTEDYELDTHFTILESFSRYCDELTRKGSASDVCRSKDELLQRADELEEDHETYIMRPRVSFDVTFQATYLGNLFKTINGNIIGSLKEKSECFEDFAVFIGDDSYKINLHHPNEIIPLDQVRRRKTSTGISRPAAAVYNNTMFITGFGEALNEIWKYNFESGWKRCGSLVQKRENHCAEFIGETLYICSGNLEEWVIDSIESYNALTEKSTVVGQLTYGSIWSACVAYKGSIYVFGGEDQNWTPLDSVQVFNPVEGTCTLLSTPLPRPSGRLRSVSWNAYALLLSDDKCFIFDFEGKTWQEKNEFKKGGDPYYFGMILHNERLFIIDDPLSENKSNVRYISIASIVNSEAPNWKLYGQLPKPLNVIAAAQLSLVKQPS